MSRKHRLVVAYDVCTTTVAGERRLRKVAQICSGYGVRIQQSVFECTLTKGQQVRMVAVLLQAIDQNQDSLRIYTLQESGQGILAFGVNRQLDLDELLLL